MSKRSLVQGNLGTIISAVAVNLRQGREIILHNLVESMRVERVVYVGEDITDMVVPVLHGLVERKRQSSTHLCAGLNAAA